MKEAPTIRRTVVSPAKINLMLAVGEKRSDGYHEIASIMQTLDLADRIDIELQPWEHEHSDIVVDVPGLVGGDTLVTAALTRLFDRIGRGARIWVSIDKNIPVGGGLGGGSSNAAATLNAVNTMLSSPIKEQELLHIAANVGSDVPFFLLGEKATALVTGRGDKVTKISDIPSRTWLLLFPHTHQSTADVYDKFDRESVDRLPNSEAEARVYTCSEHMRNDLAKPARSLSCGVDRLCKVIIDAGGSPLVCGSGATVAVQVQSKEEQRAYSAIARIAVPDCWIRLAQTTTN